MRFLNWLLSLFNKPVNNNVSVPNPTIIISSFSNQTILLINEERSKYNLSYLYVNSLVQLSAQNHANQESLSHLMAHEGIGDGEPWDRLKTLGYNYSACAENVAWGQNSPEQVVSSWMNSPGHRANILGNYTHVGVGFKDTYWCAVFASPM